MKLQKIKIISFKGIENAEIKFNEMLNFIVSNNNVGKTRILECINQFYNGTKDNYEMEFTYEISEEDKTIIKNCLNIKESIANKYIIINLKNKKYTYKKYDAKKLIEEKILGEVLYIPAVSDHNNLTDVSKTSTDISKMVAKLIEKNNSVEDKLKELNNDLKGYITLLQEVSTSTISKMNQEILFGNIELSLENKEFENSQIIKNNIQLKAKEDGEEKDISCLGTGVQRSIVNSIITAGIDSKKYTILLYDEPETFLNVNLQRKLMQEINKNKENTQYIVATHSPDIIYRNEKIFSSIIKLKKKGKNNINVFQFDNNKYVDLIRKTNIELNQKVQLVENINESVLAWWDRNRVNALFEDKVIIIEGPTEEIFMDMICIEKNIPYITTASGKFSIPYFKILFEDIFDIKTAVIYDKDDISDPRHNTINEYIVNNIKDYLTLDKDFESYLGYKTIDKHRKPQEFLEKFFNKEIEINKILQLKQAIYNLYNGDDENNE